MGAGGSTAASCSSLDLANHKQHYQHYLHEHRIQKYTCNNNKQTNNLPIAPAIKPSRNPKNNLASNSNLLKQSSHSNFDLTQNHLIMHEAQFGDMTNNGSGRPILVLPNDKNKPMSPPVHVISGAKRSNAGVASRIHHLNQRQINRANELRKFSDSLPSLNINLLDQQSILQQQRKQPYHYNRGEPMSPVSPPYALSPTDYCLGQQENLIINNNKSAKHKQQQQQIIMPSQNYRNGRNNNNHPNVNLVNNSSGNRCDDSSYLNWSSSSTAAVSERPMKRAISLSSLHNSHNSNHHHLQQQQQQHRSPHVNYGVCSQLSKQLVSKCSGAIQSQNVRKNEFFSNTTSDLQQPQPCNKHPASYMKQQQIQYNQPTPLAKKILKFKQVASNSGLSSKKYKKKQKQIQQQQQQQGCPVLPPLPRSQSLHELIQLRATENGQRMRTTGTLRGPLGSGETGNKVNLVVELLENRRKQKMNEQQQQQQQEQQQAQALGRDSTETMLSQASSSDDGIHDVSMSGGDQSTSDSRRQFSTKSPTAEKNSCNLDNNNRHSITSHQDEAQGITRQRIFNKNHQSSDRSRQQQRFGAKQHQHLYDRPQSQRLEQVEKSIDSGYMQKSAPNQHKSTLKRSVSHSALHSNNLHNLELNNDDDEDESDDLNELAKFLYQFKQRQLSNKQQLGAVGNLATPAGRKSDLENVNSASSSSTSPQHQQQQQSPNSTTSSSGFASSTCTSNSLSSANSDEPRRNIEKPTTSKINNQAQSGQNQKKGRKKYPAPKRPDDEKQSKCLSGLAKDQQISSSNNNNKNLISGQLKLSSSLLSIVDEYNSTLRTNDRASPAAINNNLNSNSSNLTSVLLGETVVTAGPNKQMDKNSLPGASKLATDIGGRRSFNNNVDSNGNSTSHYLQQQQLEQLRRYTQMRQMSQSELALNHLTSSAKTQIPQVKGKNGHDHQRNNKPYKSKLINIIRRISDKPEVASDFSSDHHSRLSGATSANVSDLPDPATNTTGSAFLQTKQTASFGKGAPINQSEMIGAYYSNQGKQKYGNNNHLKKEKTFLRGKSCLSESMCDLNFDCDFELIKNCGIEQEKVRAEKAASQVAAAKQKLPSQQPGAGSLLASADLSSRRFLPVDVERRCHKEMATKQHHYQQQQQAINLSKGENNWKLVPNPLSLDRQQASAACFPQTGKERQLVLPSRQSMDEASRERENGRVGQKAGSKGKQPQAATQDKLASQQQQVKLKWSASGWLMNSLGAGGSGGRSGSSSSSGNRTKDNELQRQQQQLQAQARAHKEDSQGGKSGLPKLISSSRTPVSAASSTNNNHDDSGRREQAAMIESNDNNNTNSDSKSFARVNSEAKQLLNELDHSLDLVSGRYPFSRKVALSWWRTTGNDDDYTATSGSNNGLHQQINIMGEGNVVHPNRFAISSSSSGSSDNSDYDLLDDDDDDDNDDYASLNRAMINATFDVDVNQIKLNEANLNSRLPIEPGSPSDSFTFSPSSSPISSSKLDNSTTATGTSVKFPPEDDKLGQSCTTKGENHMSKQSICQTNGFLLASNKQIYSQIRNSNGNHVIPSTSYDGMISHTAAMRRREAASEGGSGIELAPTDNGRRGIVSYDAGGVQRMRMNLGGGKGKGELEMVGGSKCIGGLAPISNENGSSNRFHNKESGNISKLNQDLCAHEQHEVGKRLPEQNYPIKMRNESHTTAAAHRLLETTSSGSSNNNSDNSNDNPDKHDSFRELNNKMAARRLDSKASEQGGLICETDSIPKTTTTTTSTNIGGAKSMNDSFDSSHNDNDDDISWPDDTASRIVKLNRFSPGQNAWKSQNGDFDKHLCDPMKKKKTTTTKMDDKNGKNCNEFRSCQTVAIANLPPSEGIKCNGFVSNEQPSARHFDGSIQGQLSCGLGQQQQLRQSVPFSACHRCSCCSLTQAATASPSNNCAIARDNGHMDHMNGQKQAPSKLSVKCDRQSCSSPKGQQQQQQPNGNNGRQMVAEPQQQQQQLEMRSGCHFGAMTKRCCCNSSFVDNNGNGDKKPQRNCRSSVSSSSSCVNCCHSTTAGENFSAGKSHADLHTGNGVTYSKTTAPKSEELKNKLITQKNKPFGGATSSSCNCNQSTAAAAASAAAAGNQAFTTTTVTQTTPSPTTTTKTTTNDLETIPGKSPSIGNASFVAAHQAIHLMQPPKQPLGSQFSKQQPSQVAQAAGPMEKSGFYYYDMERIYSPVARQNDRDKQQQTVAMDKVALKQQNSNLNNHQPSVGCCKVDGQNDDDDDYGDDEKDGCKVACHHHPSSSCCDCNRLSCSISGNSDEHHLVSSYNDDDEDVKSSQACVIRDNLILKTGHGGIVTSAAEEHQTLSDSKRSFSATKVAGATSGGSVDVASTNCSHRLSSAGNCRCCKNSSQHQQHRKTSHYHFNNSQANTKFAPDQSELDADKMQVKRFNCGIGKFSSPNRITNATNVDLYHNATSSKSSSNGRPLCNNTSANVNALSGAPRLICKSKAAGKPICRSNSELVPVIRKSGFVKSIGGQTSYSSNHSHDHDDHYHRQQMNGQQQQQQQHQRIPSLQNSLLNDNSSTTTTASTQQIDSLVSCESGKIAGSQMSLANYYNGSGYFVSPFIAHHHGGSATALNEHHQNQMDVEDNFILKRKTPNAGLKSLC